MSTDAWFREFERQEGERMTRREGNRERLRLWREEQEKKTPKPEETKP